VEIARLNNLDVEGAVYVMWPVHNGAWNTNCDSFLGIGGKQAKMPPVP